VRNSLDSTLIRITVSYSFLPSHNLDHVAMLLRFDMPGNGPKKDVFLIEATGSGVKVKRWSNLRPHIGKFYDRVMLRHLDFERDDKTLDNLE